MQIAFVTSEVFPFSKTGGLADVSAALPKALAALGHEVRVFTPMYESVRRAISRGVAEGTLQDGASVTQGHVLLNYLWVGDHQRQVHFHELDSEGVRIVFVENDWAFDRPGLYLDEEGRDFPDNVGRFSLLSRAVLEYCLQSGYEPDVFHCNDWQTALLPAYLHTTYQRAQFAHSASVLTIHNMGYQGIFPAEEIYSAGLGWEHYTHETLEFHGQLNLLKGGIVYADAVTTVSPTYAKEIQTANAGMGLDGLIHHYRGKLSGILNGIDTEVWNPQTDIALTKNYSAKNLKKKGVNKKELQKLLRLDVEPEALLVGMVTRLDAQKGVGLALEAFGKLRGKQIQLALLGAGSEFLEEHARELAGKKLGQVAAHIGYDEKLAHLIYAGADALLMPSLYEPCGLNQMYAQRYGTIPIVREVGGLKDTVTAYSERRLHKGKASGFTFKPFRTASVAAALRKAYRVFSEQRDNWAELQRQVMGIDNSWAASARQYERLYQRIAPGEELAGAAEARG